MVVMDAPAALYIPACAADWTSSNAMTSSKISKTSAMAQRIHGRKSLGLCFLVCVLPFLVVFKGLHGEALCSRFGRVGVFLGRTN